MHRTSRAELVAWLAAIALGAASLPAIWWEPLHLDERVMLEFAGGSPWGIAQNVFVERGGGPAQFLVERVTLAWPGGLVGLRGPSLVFFLLALPCAGLLARRLAGRTEAIAVPLLLALAPLAVGLATFARMYALFMLLVFVAALTAIRAGRDRSQAWWVAAGVLGAGLVYVHPIAPLYAALAFACGLAVRNDSLRSGIREARFGLLAATIVAAPYLYALWPYCSHATPSERPDSCRRQQAEPSSKRHSVPCRRRERSGSQPSACSLSEESSGSPASASE